MKILSGSIQQYKNSHGNVSVRVIIWNILDFILYNRKFHGLRDMRLHFTYYTSPQETLLRLYAEHFVADKTNKLKSMYKWPIVKAHLSKTGWNETAEWANHRFNPRLQQGLSMWRLYALSVSMWVFYGSSGLPHQFRFAHRLSCNLICS